MKTFIILTIGAAFGYLMAFHPTEILIFSAGALCSILISLYIKKK